MLKQRNEILTFRKFPMYSMMNKHIPCWRTEQNDDTYKYI